MHDMCSIKTLHCCCRPWAFFVFSAPGARHQGAMVRDISLATTLHTEGTTHILQHTHMNQSSPFFSRRLTFLSHIHPKVHNLLYFRFSPSFSLSHTHTSAHTVCFNFATLSFICSLSGCPRARKSGIKIIHSKENKEDQEPIRYSTDTHHQSSVSLILHSSSCFTVYFTFPIWNIEHDIWLYSSWFKMMQVRRVNGNKWTTCCFFSSAQ